jgi:hypothetical protein
MKKLKVFILFICIHASSFAQEKTWPKLMQLFDGKVVQVRYDNMGVGFFYLDWRDSIIPNMMAVPFNNETAKFLYVDSTGQQIGKDYYEDAYPFNGGLAVVGTPRPFVNNVVKKYAVINEKAEIVFPYSEEPKFTIGNGLVVIDKKDKQEVYDQNNKRIAECNDCSFETNVGLPNIVVNPKPNTNAEKIVKLLDANGHVLYSGRGRRLSQISNDISTRLYTFSVRQPFYEVELDDLGEYKTIVSRTGKVMMDSVKYSFFARGKSCILKNGIATVVDTNFKTLMPYSYGYDFYRHMTGHPQDAYCARKNGKYIVISPANKQLVPMTLTYTEIWYKPEQQLYEGRDEEGNFWYMTLAGDTVASPRKYRDVYFMEPVMPGFLVRSKATNLAGYLSSGGEEVIPCKYSYLAFGGKDLILFFKDGGGAGYMDMKGNLKLNIPNAFSLSAFIEGYALVGVRIDDRSQFSNSAQTVMNGQETYQVQNRLIDSTGKFVSKETFDWMFVLRKGYAGVIDEGELYVVDKNLKKVMVEGAYLTSYFYKGLAMAYNPKKKKWGVVNEKLEIVVPIAYDEIETKEEEGVIYNYYMSTPNGSESGGLFKNMYPNIKGGKLSVVCNGFQEIIPVKGAR